jgi:hypothetical protein
LGIGSINSIAFRVFFIYLTPFIPLSFKGEGEEKKKRGFAPLKLYVLLTGDGLVM